MDKRSAPTKPSGDDVSPEQQIIDVRQRTVELVDELQGSLALLESILIERSKVEDIENRRNGHGKGTLRHVSGA